MKNIVGFLGTASLALTLPALPAHAAADATNFKVKNCTSERIFVCSFNKTDGSLKIPYKAAGVQPNDKKEFGCASLNKCKVIIGVSRKKPKDNVSTGVNALLEAGSAAEAATPGITAVFPVAGIVVKYAPVTLAAVGAAIFALPAEAAIAGLEISDGLNEGEVCDQVRKAAQKAGMKPKSFMKDGKVYQIVEQYATDQSGNPYVNHDGTAVLTYAPEADKGQCPAPLDTQLVKD